MIFQGFFQKNISVFLSLSAFSGTENVPDFPFEKDCL